MLIFNESTANIPIFQIFTENITAYFLFMIHHLE